MDPYDHTAALREGAESKLKSDLSAGHGSNTFIAHGVRPKEQAKVAGEGGQRENGSCLIS